MEEYCPLVRGSPDDGEKLSSKSIGFILIGRFYMSKVYSQTARATTAKKVQLDKNDRSVVRMGVKHKYPF